MKVLYHGVMPYRSTARNLKVALLEMLVEDAVTGKFKLVQFVGHN
jgi:hypothetical protein